MKHQVLASIAAWEHWEHATWRIHPTTRTSYLSSMPYRRLPHMNIDGCIIPKTRTLTEVGGWYVSIWLPPSMNAPVHECCIFPSTTILPLPTRYLSLGSMHCFSLDCGSDLGSFVASGFLWFWPARFEPLDVVSLIYIATATVILILNDATNHRVTVEHKL